jgi:hypothetical protein
MSDNSGADFMNTYGMNTRDDLSERIKGPVFFIGATLVLAGAISLVYLAISVIQVIQSPQESELVQWITSTAGNTDLVLSGHFDGKKFEVHATEAFQYLFLGIIGLAMLSILATVVNALVSGGIKLIMFAKQESGEQEEKKSNN